MRSTVMARAFPLIAWFWFGTTMDDEPVLTSGKDIGGEERGGGERRVVVGMYSSSEEEEVGNMALVSMVVAETLDLGTLDRRTLRVNRPWEGFRELRVVVTGGPW